ncbi:MAG TPA: hypothetical protein ENK04_15470 [Gammaproteobacteria bacterium]|nr:hypothetical protein [Gammaproteobacteria bacterium]
MFCLQRKSKPPFPGCLPVKLPLDLLGKHSRHIREIQQLAGIPQPHWRTFYLDALLSYANYVQLLPASEAHHHAGRGGLLVHGLEVALHALRLRRAHLLPQGADTEEIVAKREVWTYAVFSAALLHDIGKPLMDQDITRYDHRGEDLGPWDALTSPLSPNTWYHIRFRRDREHRLHERVAPLLSRLVFQQEVALLDLQPSQVAFLVDVTRAFYEQVFVSTGIDGTLRQSGAETPATAHDFANTLWPVLETGMIGLKLFALRVGHSDLDAAFPGADHGCRHSRWLCRLVPAPYRWRTGIRLYLHRAKRGLAWSFLLLWVVYLIPPVPMDPKYLLPPFLIASGIATRLHVAFFKKYL